MWLLVAEADPHCASNANELQIHAMIMVRFQCLLPFPFALCTWFTGHIRILATTVLRSQAANIACERCDDLRLHGVDGYGDALSLSLLLFDNQKWRPPLLTNRVSLPTCY